MHAATFFFSLSRNPRQVYNPPVSSAQVCRPLVAYPRWRCHCSPNTVLPHSRDQISCSSFVVSMSLKRTWKTPKATSNGKAHLNRLPGSPREHWLAKCCVRRRTFTLKERKGNKYKGLLLSRTTGRKATKKNGQDYCSFTEACSRKQ